MLDRYLREQAGQDAKKRVAAPFVLCEGESNVVLGYYTYYLAIPRTTPSTQPNP